MNKKQVLNRTALLSLLLAGGVTATTFSNVHAENNQSTKVVGTFYATTLDVEIPVMSTFIYTPDTEKLTTGNMTFVSHTNAPIYMKLNSIDVDDESRWKPTLVIPDTYSDEKWKNLSNKESNEKVSLGFYTIDGNNWLGELENSEAWYQSPTIDKKIGVIQNKGIVYGVPTVKSGNSFSSNTYLTTNYVFEFGLEEGEPVAEPFVLPEELRSIEDNGKTLIKVRTDTIDGVENRQTIANDNLTKAIELASPGDGVYIEEGDYHIESNDVFWTSPYKKYSNMVLRKPLTLVGEEGNNTILIVDDENSTVRRDGQSFGITFNAPNITMKNMTIHVNQSNVKNLWAIFNIWGNWDGSTSRNLTLEDITVIIDSPVDYLFYMNDYNLTVKNMKVISNGNLKHMFYWNYGNATISDSTFDIPKESSSYVQYINTTFK